MVKFLIFRPIAVTTIFFLALLILGAVAIRYIPVSLIPDAVKYVQRSSLNYVDTYELFYFDLGRKSLGKKVATDSYLEYDNVPHKAILLLRDLSQRNERGFLSMRMVSKFGSEFVLLSYVKYNCFN